MIDIEHVNATHREIGEAAVATGAGRSVLLRRSYDSPIADVWSACTSRDRLARWFGQVDGDLQLGGSFQVKDNAGGEIIACEEPRLLKVTWVLGPGMATEVEVRLSADGDGTTLELEHSTPAEVLDELVRSYGPGGTIGAGVGWDLALVELEKFLDGTAFDPATWEDTAEAKEFATRACRAWGPVIQDAWGTSDDDIAAAIAFAVSHFAPSADQPPSPI